MNAFVAIRQAKAHGARFDVEGADLVVEFDEELPSELVNEIRRHKSEIIAIIAPPADIPDGWDHETRKLIEWFRATPAPSGPIALCPGVIIQRPELYWQRLNGAIKAGPGRARGKLGTFQQDLRWLHRLLGKGVAGDQLETDQ